MSRSLTEAEMADEFARRTSTLSGTHTLAQLTGESIVVRLDIDDDNLRANGSISGPTLMTLTDLAGGMLVLALAKSGPDRLPVPSDFVTTNLTIHFLRPCVAGWVQARAKRIKQAGRSVVEVSLTDETDGLTAVALIEFSRRS